MTVVTKDKRVVATHYNDIPAEQVRQMKAAGYRVKVVDSGEKPADRNAL